MRSLVRNHRIAPLLLLTAVVGGGCDASSTEVDSGPIEGIWVARAANADLFLVISADSVVYYEALDSEDCADRFAYGLTATGDNDYLLDSSVNFATVAVSITQVDDELTWRTGLGSARFHRADADPADLAVCAGGGDDPALTCTSLQAIQLDQDLNGSLADGDAEERGRYYDVYSFQPATPISSAEITVTSPAFDVYLYVYDSAGALIAENDDGIQGSTDVSLTLPLNPVCYRVEVTTAGAAATGAYTLRIQ